MKKRIIAGVIAALVVCGLIAIICGTSCIVAGYSIDKYTKEELVTMIEEVLANNPSAIEDYRNGKTRAVGFIVGQVMKASRGQANPQMTNKLVKEIMDSKL